MQQQDSSGRERAAPDPARSKQRAVRAFVVLSSALFAGAVVYAIMTKIFHDEFAEDWAHTALHTLFAATGVWVLRLASPHAASGYSLAVLILYGLLFWAGVQREAIFGGTPVVVPLGIADNVFHAGLAGLALIALALHRLRPLEVRGA